MPTSENAQIKYTNRIKICVTWKIQMQYIRVCHIFLDFKVSRYIEGYSF